MFKSKLDARLRTPKEPDIFEYIPVNENDHATLVQHPQTFMDPFTKNYAFNLKDNGLFKSF